MIKKFFTNLIQELKNSPLASNKANLIRTIITFILVLVVIIAIFIVRSGTGPNSGNSPQVSTTPPASETIEPSELLKPAVTTPMLPEETHAPPTPTPEPPAITPPADESHPSSGSDIIFESAPPATDTDISA